MVQVQLSTGGTKLRLNKLSDVLGVPKQFRASSVFELELLTPSYQETI